LIILSFDACAVAKSVGLHTEASRFGVNSPCKEQCLDVEARAGPTGSNDSRSSCRPDLLHTAIRHNVATRACLFDIVVSKYRHEVGKEKMDQDREENQRERGKGGAGFINT